MRSHYDALARCTSNLNSSGLPSELTASLDRGPMVVPLDQPLTVVQLDEGPDDLAGLLEALEVVQVQALLLEGPDPTLNDPVALRFSHVGRGRSDPEPPQSSPWNWCAVY